MTPDPDDTDPARDVAREVAEIRETLRLMAEGHAVGDRLPDVAPPGYTFRATGPAPVELIEDEPRGD